MALDAEVLHNLTKGSAVDAWRVIIDKAVEIASRPLAAGNASSEVTKRDREIGALDHFLSSSGWDLWQTFGEPEVSGVERTSDRLARWWGEPYSAKAVLILDGLSLRELPWLIQGAKERGFTLHEVTANASELPGETNEFAQALGFGSRSQLQNNGGGLAHRLQPTHTECVDMPWKDCEGLINSAPGAKNWVFWHHWPDSKLHDGSGAGQGLDTLTRDVADHLGRDDFWAFVERLATGRRLVITSDHGYAATGYFPDADGDLVPDPLDNCLLVPNATGWSQFDYDVDGYGNRCDGDLDNDGFVDGSDWGLFLTNQGSAYSNSDLDGNGLMDGADVGIFIQELLNRPVGESGLACAGHPPCVP